MNPEHPTQAPLVVIVGQTPPPWHGQAVATQLLFDADWAGFEVRTIRMAFSSDIEEIGRVQFHKAKHIFELLRSISEAVGDRDDAILLYPPASPNWVPVLRDLILLPLIRGKFRKVVYIYHAGGVGAWCAKSLFRRSIVRLTYGRPDLSLEVAKENPAPHTVLAARQWAWTPYGVKLPELPFKKRNHGGPTVVLFVGSLQEGKGVLEVLRTASLLKQLGMESDFRFQLVGKWFSNEFEDSVRHLQAELDLDRMVDFPGQLTGDRKWKAYSAADVFFFPTHYASEAFPLVLIEALGSGLPVVTTRWRGIPDLFDGCTVASLCEIHSPSEYADALITIRKKSEEGVCFSESARSFYRKHYLPESFLLQVKSLIGSLAIEAHGAEGTEFLNGRRSMHPIQVLPDSQKSEDHVNANARAGRIPDSLPADPEQPTSPEISEPVRIENVAGTKLHSVIHISAYLADQNPGHDRSFGISRMSQVVLESLQSNNCISLEIITSRTSQQAPESVSRTQVLPWGTRKKWVRLLTDHLHPLFMQSSLTPDLHYFPKGYLPLLDCYCRPSVVTIHDTIIQYDEDHYPKWRKPWEYGYWSKMLKHTLRKADRILTVSESSKRQINVFMDRHRIPAKPITVTYEPCLYERVPQPDNPEKENYVIHLASCEPHKRTAHLIRWWHDAETRGRKLSTLHLIGTVPPEVSSLLATAKTIVKRPFLEDSALLAAYLGAKALILPSEIEGFGLPALEAYYLGTPVCFVKETSVAEILSVATNKGEFSLDDPESLFSALDAVIGMSPEEVRQCGLILRETYASQKVAGKMLEVFQDLAGSPH